jgi:hypothetical protein
MVVRHALYFCVIPLCSNELGPLTDDNIIRNKTTKKEANNNNNNSKHNIKGFKFMSIDMIDNNNNSISILYYLCAVSTAVRPITDTAQCTRK